MQPDNDHGDQRHITMRELVDAAEANGFSAREVMSNMEKTTEAVLQGKVQSEAIGEGGLSGQSRSVD
jgi:hypothetical protein